jgi:dTDP-4-amino-4,6-dideoxygalactose transaminase
MGTLPVEVSGVPRPAAEVPASPGPTEFLDLKAQFRSIRDEVMAAIVRIMESQHFILGTEVTAFESEFTDAFRTRHSVACASGSDALVLALMAAEIAKGDEVITSPFTFFATAGAIARVGATPVFVDIDPATYNFDPSHLAHRITPRTRAIMPVHLFGLMAELDPVQKLAQSHSLYVIEDAAQAIGARYQGAYAGTFGDFAAFSFFPSKNLGGAGDGGLVTVREKSLAERIRLLRVHGSSRKYFHDILGTNSRLDALQAAILRVKLRRLEHWTSQRRLRASYYDRLLNDFGLTEFVTPPVEPPGRFHVYNQYSIRCQDRDQLREYLKTSGVPTEVYYPLPLHLQQALQYLGGREGQFPHAEKAAREVLALPVYPELSDSQQEYVISKINEFYRKRR